MGQTPLFGAYFRMNAGRALVLPRPRPGVRRPFWLQRLKAADLLQVVRRFDEFPVVLETYREVLRDVLDMEGLKEVLAAIRSGEIAIEAVETDSPSPMSAQILMLFIAENLYEWDTPRAEKRGALLGLNRELLREILGAEALRELLDPRAITVVEDRLQRRAEGWRPRHADETEDLLRSVGDLAPAELAERGVEPAWLAQLERERRAVLLSIAGEGRWIARDDLGLYGDVSGHAGAIIRRYGRTHGPFQPEALTARYGLDRETVLRYLQLFQAEGLMVAGEYTQGVAGREYCDLEVLQQVHRQTLTLLRREIEPVDAAAYTRFLLDWMAVGSQAAPRPAGRASGPSQALLRALTQLQGLMLPAEVWEREILPRRVPGYQPVWLDQLCASGELHWAAGPGGRLAFYMPDQAHLFADRLGAVPPEPLTPEQERVLEACRAAGADFLGGIARASGLPPSATLETLWELAWMGLVSNDTFAPLRQALRPTRAAASRGRPLPQLQGGTGRWWLTARLVHGAEAGSVEGYAQLLLDRYGVVTREAVDADGGPASWSEVLDALKRMEWKGHVRQGYFIAGLTGAQFARPDAVDRLRQAREQASGAMRLLPATDPANPYGAILPWPADTRLSRLASNFVVLAGGEPVLAVEGHGKRLTPLAPLEVDQLHQALATLPDLLNAPAPVRSLRRIEVSEWGEEPIHQSPAAEALAAVGFERAPRKMVYYP